MHQITPICLPPSEGWDVVKEVGNRALHATGWGERLNGTKSDTLLIKLLQLTPDEECLNLYKSRYHEHQVKQYALEISF